MEKESKILVIIVSYRAVEWLKVCLAPFALDRDGLDIMVIDNASDDGTADQIAKEYPFVTLHRRPSNLGFGAANNIGIEYALENEYKGVFLLNQDASISAQAIREIANRLDFNLEIGLASPTHRSALGGEREKGFSNWAGASEVESRDFVSLPFINAALWYLPRRTLMKVGLFSPLFYHYGEDKDYYNRVVAEGLQAGYFPDLEGIHLRDSSKGISSEKQRVLEYAYHLSEFAHPSYSKYKRLWKGPILLALNGIKGELAQHIRDSRKLWAQRKTVNLWVHRPSLDLEGLQRTQKLDINAPVLLLVYDRMEHTRRVLEALMKQPEILSTPLYILSDGPKDSESSRSRVAGVREVISEVKERLPLTSVWLQEKNVGLAQNVTEGVSKVLEKHDRVIVVEDDLILSPYFLRWMNDVLETYKDVPEVAHVHAGTFYTNEKLSDNHLLHFAGSWGWGTWRDRWSQYWEADGTQLLMQLQSDDRARKHFEYGGFQNFTRMLRRQTEGLNNSWAVRWHASLVLERLLSVNSNPPLVSNGGFDGSGTHSSADNRYATAVCPYPLYAPKDISRVEDKKAYRILKNYYRRTNNKVAKGWYKLIELTNRRRVK